MASSDPKLKGNKGRNREKGRATASAGNNFSALGPHGVQSDECRWAEPPNLSESVWDLDTISRRRLVRMIHPRSN